MYSFRSNLLNFFNKLLFSHYLTPILFKSSALLLTSSLGLYITGLNSLITNSLIIDIKLPSTGIAISKIDKSEVLSIGLDNLYTEIGFSNILVTVISVNCKKLRLLDLQYKYPSGPIVT